MAETAGDRRVVILAGPNGAGKTTTAEAVIRDVEGIACYANADTIARGLAAFEVERGAVEAGRVMIRWLERLAGHGEPFGFETTLSGLSWIRHIARWRELGYTIGLVYVWLPSAEMAVQRVAKRVAAGGHAIPPEVIRRRYQRGLENFWNHYRPVVDWWAVYDNEHGPPPRDVAEYRAGGLRVANPVRWALFLRSVENGSAEA